MTPDNSKARFETAKREALYKANEENRHAMGIWRLVIGACHTYCSNCGRGIWVDYYHGLQQHPDHGAESATETLCKPDDPVYPFVGGRKV